MSRKWVIPDIHGCYNTLQTLIENQLKPGDDDQVYFLGDYIDRGPSSREVIDYIRKLKSDGLKVVSLMGNHEESMINAWRESLHPKKLFFVNRSTAKKMWYTYGGNTTMKSFGTDDMRQIPDDYTSWLNDLELFIEEEKFLLAHAGFNFKTDDIFGDTHAMRWIRDFEVDMKKTSGRKVVHGHVPVPLDLIEEFIKNEKYNYIDLDNGCVYPDRNGMGNLVALDLNSMELKVQRNLDM